MKNGYLEKVERDGIDDTTGIDDTLEGMSGGVIK